MKTEILRAFEKIQRRDFVLPNLIELANEDAALPIYEGQTISQPSTVSFMLKLLNPRKGDKVLDVGSGSGWTTALLAEIVGPEGKVFGTEIIPKLVEFGRSNLKKYNLNNAEITLSNMGLHKEAPFDRILVSAAAQEVPKELLEQLEENGIMVIPVQNSILQIQKKNHEVAATEFPGFAFVPLIG